MFALNSKWIHCMLVSGVLFVCAIVANGQPAGGECNGGEPMSQDEIVSFLRQRLGPGDAFMNPKREAIHKELAHEILCRGVNFRYQIIGQFANDMAKLGMTTNVSAAMTNNFGKPVKADWLFGRWDLMKVGGTTDFARGNTVYQRQEYAGIAGTLMVNTDGSYVWNSPSGVFKGKWRKATAEEMAKSDRGGEGIVLLQAKSSGDWIVFRRTDEGLNGKDGIRISDLVYRGTTEYATRH